MRVTRLRGLGGVSKLLTLSSEIGSAHMNCEFFMRMANGDVLGFKALAFEFFNDTRRLMTGWGALMAAGHYGRLRDELHRCKGGASLFGLEELVAMIAACEAPLDLEVHGFDLDAFENEVTRSEEMVCCIVAKESLAS